MCDRKPLDLSVGPVCRVCLTDNNSMYDIYVDKCVDLTVVTALRECASLEISSDDGLPSSICETCSADLDRFLRFKRRCHESDRILKRRHDRVKIENVRPEYICVRPDINYQLSDVDRIKTESDEGRVEYRDVETGRSCFDTVESDARENEPETETYVESPGFDPRKRKRSRDEDAFYFKDGFCPNVQYRFDAATRSDDRPADRVNAGVPATAHRPHVCTGCGKAFAKKGNLASHYKTHTREKPYKCDVCAKSFSQNGQLKEHAMTHLDERPFKCALCLKSYSFKYRLEYHLKNHSGERPHKCDFCGRAFFQRSHLVDHRRTHTGEKPFACGVCGKSFSQKSHMRVHATLHAP